MSSTRTAFSSGATLFTFEKGTFEVVDGGLTQETAFELFEFALLEVDACVAIPEDIEFVLGLSSLAFVLQEAEHTTGLWKIFPRAIRKLFFGTFDAWVQPDFCIVYINLLP